MNLHPEWSYGAVLYEMNVRQLTPEGTLRAAAAKLGFLHDMGVDAVWLMPIYPIGELDRKGTLGSYYSIRDYRAVNPEFGTMDDLDSFIAEAHRLYMPPAPCPRWTEEREHVIPNGNHDPAGRFSAQY